SQHLRVLDPQAGIARRRYLSQRLLVGIERHAVGGIANGMRAHLEAALERPPRQTIDPRLRRGHDALAGGRVAVPLAHARPPREPSAPSANSLMARMVSRCCGSISGPRANHSSTRAALAPSSITYSRSGMRPSRKSSR